MSGVLVTGAAGDIGAAIAERCARRFDRVTVADHPASEAQLEQTASACRAAGADVVSLTFDVTDGDAANDAIRALGPLSGLVNSAGYQGVFASVDVYPLDDARRVLDVNVVGLLTVLAAAARVMKQHRQPSAIVNIASMAGVSGAPNMAAYSASKAAVIGLTKAAAKDLAPAGIRVNCVSPGFVGPGRMWDAQVAAQAGAPSQYYADEPAEVASQMVAMVPLRRYASPSEVAAAVEFLLSDEASYVTGVNLEVSGGSV